MKQIKQTKEILSTKIWEVDPAYARSLKPMLEAYLNRENEAKDFEDDGHSSGWFALKSLGYKNRRVPRDEKELDASEDLIVTHDPEYDTTQHWWEEEGPLIKPEDEFINVIDITSSVTRNGGWCSAGSIEHRDQMVFASKFPNCIGHIFIVDTPGGSAYAKNDYQQGIEAARAAGQPVLVWIDGMCCSAGVAASVQADEIYVQHPNCEVGCIGTMAAFYTIADGEKESERSNYVYHEVYDPQSFEKNLEYRELANKGNAEPLMADLAEDGAAFRALVKAHRPKVKEEMLHGKVYKASELYSILVDGQKSFDEVVERIIELNGGAAIIDHSYIESDPVADGEDSETADEPSEEPESKKSIDLIKNNINMKQYSNINKALELESIPVTADGSIANLDPASCEVINNLLADKVTAEESLKAHKQSVADLNEKVKELNSTIAALTDEKKALESSVASKEEAITNLEKANTELGTERDNLKQQLSDSEANHATEVKKLREEIESLKTEVTEKDKEISELSQQAPETPGASPAPAAEEEQHDEQPKAEVHKIYSAGMTAAEKAKAKAERMAQLDALRK